METYRGTQNAVPAIKRFARMQDTNAVLLATNERGVYAVTTLNDAALRGVDPETVIIICNRNGDY